MWKGILICHKKLYLVAKIHIFSLFSLYFRFEGRSWNSKKERKKKKGFCSILVLHLRFQPHLKLNQKQNNTQTNKPRRQTQQKKKRQKLRKGGVPIGSGEEREGKWRSGLLVSLEPTNWAVDGTVRGGKKEWTNERREAWERKGKVAELVFYLFILYTGVKKSLDWNTNSY